MRLKTELYLILSVATLLAGCRREFFTNPVLPQGADPWVVLHEGRWYYCCAHGNIAVSVSDTLYRINPPREVWRPVPGTWNGSNVWAPELHRWQGRWYILYAAGKSGPPYTWQRAGVLESVGDDPLGEWRDRGMVYTGDSLGVWSSNRWAIDMTLLEHRGKLYAVWSGWETAEATDKTPQNLYIAEMENPWTARSSRVLISRPDTHFEDDGRNLPINEGPQVLRHGQELFIVYSCGQSWLDTYKLAALRLRSPEADPLDPQSWIKSDGPLFEGNEGAYGVGHASFTTSRDGREHYIVYHSKTSRKPGWARDVRMQRFDFGPDGWPHFGDPVAPGVPQRAPKERQRTKGGR